MTVVTFTTDFGTADGYVGAMKGVVLSLAADAVLVDITHEIPRHDVQAGAFALAQAAPLFPAGTVHLAVVDPGVGGDRHEVLVQAGGSFYVGPDNGLLSLATRGATPPVVRAIGPAPFRRATVSPTFHGRDVFAQTAGQLAAGADPAAAGPTLPALAALPGWGEEAEALAPVVLHVDAFGNVITCWGQWQLPSSAFVLEAPDGQRFSFTPGRTYSDVATGQLVAYLGSAGKVELAVRDGSAAAHVGLRRGDRLRLRTPT